MWEELPDLPAMRSAAVTAWAGSPVKIISEVLPEKAVIFSTAMRTMIWICPAKARAALPEKSVMMELCMATIIVEGGAGGVEALVIRAALPRCPTRNSAAKTFRTLSHSLPLPSRRMV